MACHALKETGAPYWPPPTTKPTTSPVPAPTYEDDDDTAEIMSSIGSYLGDAVELIKMAAGVQAKEERTAKAYRDAEIAKAQAQMLQQSTPQASPMAGAGFLGRELLGVPLWLWGVGAVGGYLVLRKR